MKRSQIPLMSVMAVLVLLFVLSLPADIQNVYAAEKVFLKMGVTSSTSGSFVGPAAFARVITKYTPGVELLPLESGATYDNLYRMKENIFDMGAFFFDGVMECYNGWGIFKGKSWKDVRVMLMRTGVPIHVSIYVRKGSKIKGFADFVGTDLKLCPGIPGSGAEQFLRNAVQALGVKVNIVPMGYTDAIKGMRERRVEGVFKTATSFEIFDSSMQEVNLTYPLTIVGWTEQEAKKIKSVHGQYPMRYYKKGINKQDPSAGDFWIYSPFSTYYGSNKISEEVVYRMAKTACTHVKDLLAADSTSAKDPAGDLVKTLVELGFAHDKVTPIHAGTVRYLKEKGVKVPDYLIPPEFKK